MTPVSQTISRDRRRSAGFSITILLLLGLVSCSESTKSSTSTDGRGRESFLAVRASLDESNLTGFNGADVATFSLFDSEIVPDVRVARSNDATLIAVFGNTRTTEADYLGYPFATNGQFIVWSRSSQQDELVLINPDNGERTKLHSGQMFANVSYFEDIETLVVNSRVCDAVRLDGEVRRLGIGQCVGTSLGLRLIEQGAESITVSVIDELLEVSDRRKFPIIEATLSASGALVYGRSVGSGSLAVFELATGRKLWTSKPTDFRAEVISSSKSGDSLLVAQDSDDNDNLVDLFSIRVDETGASVKKLFSARTLSAQLSSDGTAVMIATRPSSESVYSYQTENLLTGESSELNYVGEPSGLALSSTNSYAFTNGGTLYVGTFGDAPQRALDIFGEVTGLVEIVGESTLLVLTNDSGQAELTIVRNTDSAPKAKLVLSVFGRLAFNPQLGSRSELALVTAVDQDGYGTLYEVSLADKFEAKRLAEGNIGWFSYGPKGNVFYGDVLNGEMSVYEVTASDKPRRTLVSTRYMVVRQGPSVIRETSGGFLQTIQAYLDPTLDLCKKQRLQLITLQEGSIELTLNEMGQGGPATLCIQVPLQVRGSSFDLSLVQSPEGGSEEEQFDSAFEMLSTDVGSVDAISSADSLDVLATADDSATDTYSTSSFESQLSRFEFSRPTYMMRGYSWSQSASAQFLISKPLENPETSTTFSRDDWKNRAASYRSCKGLPTLVASPARDGTEMEFVVGVDINGDAEIKQFCLSVPRALEQTRTEHSLYLIPDDTRGGIAELALGCADLQARQSSSGRPYGSLSSPREIVGFESRESDGFGSSQNTTLAVFELTKGLFGPCYLTHQSPRPAEAGSVTRAKVRMTLESPG